MIQNKNNKKKILVKDALAVITLDEKNRKFIPGSIYIEGNAIKDIGDSLDYKADEVIEASNCLVLPGFINTHHHLFQTLTRNIIPVQNAKLFDWLVYLYEIWKNLTPEAIYISALVGLGELLLTGATTTVDQLYLFPKGLTTPAELIEAEITAAKEIGIRFHPSRGSMSCGRSSGGLPPDEVVQEEDAILEDSERVIKKYHDSSFGSMCQIVLAPCSPFSVSPQLMKETAKLARKYKVRLHTHLAETKDEEEYCLKRYGMRPLELMETVDWLGEDVWFAHAVYLTDDEIKKLAINKTGVAHCPTSNMRLGSGIAPIPKMIKAGVPVGLAVDGSASNDTSDMLAELRQCLLLHRVSSGVDSMNVETVLRMATNYGAQLLGRQDIGSLEVGKVADLILINLNQLGYAGGAVHDPMGAVIFCGDSHIVDTVIVNGEIVVKNGRLTKVDQDKLIREANRIARKLISVK